MTFGGQTDEAAASKILAQCWDAGINFIDTANIYNLGDSEAMLGRLIKGRRSQIVLASKVRGKMGNSPDECGVSRRAIVRAIEDTLRRLATDYLDLYYLHQPDYAVPLEETLAAMDEIVRTGKVRYPAASNHAAWQMVNMLRLSERSNYAPPYVTQPMYNLLARGIEQEYLPMCREFGVSTVVYNPLAGGLLTGKHRRDAPIAGTRFDNNQMYLDRYWHQAYFDAVEELRREAGRISRSLVSIALNWLLDHSTADCVILGASRPEHLEENLKTLEDGPLPPETLAVCDRVWNNLRGVTPRYNR